MPKCMANASFYRPKFGTIDLMTNCWVGGHTWLGDNPYLLIWTKHHW
jgi:hypothetical protein